ACVIVSHDLGVIEHMADRVGVLYLGALVEIGPRDEVFSRPRHPYTRKLLASTPHLEGAGEGRYRLARRTLPEPMAGLYEPAVTAAPYRHPEVAPGHLVACPAR